MPKQELLDQVWVNTVVSDELLRGYIRELRDTLGDNARKPRFIETVPTRGYRFLLRVELEAPSSPVNARTQALPLERKQAKAQRELRVGILHSLTGSMAWTESPVVDSTLLAIEEINGQGGILGRQIRSVVTDGESEETAFARQAERLIAQEKVCAIFGCWTSSSRKSVLPIVEKQDHLLIYPTQYERMKPCPNIYYTGAAPNQQIVPAVRWAFGFLRKKRFFLVGWNSVYSRAVNAVIRDEVEGLGGEIIGEEYVLPDSTEVTRVVRTIAQSEPDVIFNSLVGDTNLFYTRLLRAAGITPAKVPTVYFSIGEIELLSLSTRETFGDYAAWNYFQSLDRPDNRVFVEKFRSRYGRHRVTADPMEAVIWESISGRRRWNKRERLKRQPFEKRCRTRDSMLRVVPSELTLRINILGRRCDWIELSKADNSRPCGAPKSPFDRNLIPVLALRPPGMNSLLGFSENGTDTGPNLRIRINP